MEEGHPTSKKRNKSLNQRLQVSRLTSQKTSTIKPTKTNLHKPTNKIGTTHVSFLPLKIFSQTTQVVALLPTGGFGFFFYEVILYGTTSQRELKTREEIENGKKERTLQNCNRKKQQQKRKRQCFSNKPKLIFISLLCNQKSIYLNN